MNICYFCGSPTWVWHPTGENFKYGHCETCGSVWSMMDEGELDLEIVHDPALLRSNDIKWFMEEWTSLDETGCNWTECVPIVCPDPTAYALPFFMEAPEPLLWEGAD